MGIMDGLVSMFGVAQKEEVPAVLPGRNEPCWCGSGLKYKKCHADKDAVKSYVKSSACCVKKS